MFRAVAGHPIGGAAELTRATPPILPKNGKTQRAATTFAGFGERRLRNYDRGSARATDRAGAVVADLTWRMRSVERDAAAARMLAGDADRDVAEISAQTQRLPPGHRGERRRDGCVPGRAAHPDRDPAEVTDQPRQRPVTRATTEETESLTFTGEHDTAGSALSSRPNLRRYGRCPSGGSDPDLTQQPAT